MGVLPFAAQAYPNRPNGLGFGTQTQGIQMSETKAPEEQDGPVVTQLMPVMEQVGRHVMSALQDPEAVAVLTTMVPGMGVDRVVSVGLSREQMSEVSALLEQIEEEDEEAAADDERCIGFQCRVYKD
jgi:hypothetical protein